MRVLVAGATSVLGRALVTELRRRGHVVRALSRRDAQGVGADETAQGDALVPQTLSAAFAGVDAVVSSVGASVLPDPRYGLRGFHAVDVPANCNLIDAALAARVQRFVYVSVFGAQQSRHLAYCDAHEQVVDYLKQKQLAHAVVRPTAFFSALGELVTLAKRGVVPVFGSGHRSNPIADADLAVACADALEDGRDRDVGGPDVLSRREMAELAIRAAGRGRVLALPPFFLRIAALAAFALPRLRQLFLFFAHVMSRDLVAPVAGKHRLAEHLRSLPTARGPS